MSSEQIMAPRITAGYLERFQNHTVRILGKVTSLRGDNATLDSAGEVNLILNREANLFLNNCAEVIGKVDKDLSVRVLSSSDWGSNVDLEIYKAVVDATHRYPEIFYDKDQI